jgi:hypothetical protein
VLQHLTGDGALLFIGSAALGHAHAEQDRAVQALLSGSSPLLVEDACVCFQEGILKASSLGCACFPSR